MFSLIHEDSSRKYEDSRVQVATLRATNSRRLIEEYRYPKQNKRISINICGEMFETMEKTLQRFPNTLLGNIELRRQYYCQQLNEYYFDRDRKCFEQILFFYQSFGILRCPPTLNLVVFAEECKFFGLPDEAIREMKLKAGVLTQSKRNSVNYVSVSAFSKLWNILENPRSSIAATIFMIISTSAIITSITLAILDSVYSIKIKYQSKKLDENPMSLLELILNSFFLIELLTRLICSPSKKKFFLGWLNWVDAVAVIPYFILLMINPEKSDSVGILRILRLVRVLRLLKLSKQSKRLQVCGFIIKTSLGDLQLLLLCLFIVVTLAGSILYYFEESPTSKFTSIPMSLWWGLITMLTIGYGDITPETTVGKVFAAFLMIFGVLTLTLPVLSIVAKFKLFYEKNITEPESKKRNDKIKPPPDAKVTNRNEEDLVMANCNVETVLDRRVPVLNPILRARSDFTGPSGNCRISNEIPLSDLSLKK